MSGLDINQLRGMANNFIFGNYSHYLSGNRHQLVMACMQHLMDVMEIPEAPAVKVALQQVAEYESYATGVSLDLNRSSAALVVLTDQRANRRVFFTVDDLLTTASPIMVRPIR